MAVKFSNACGTTLTSNIAVIGDTISVSLILSRMLGTRLLNEITLN